MVRSKHHTIPSFNIGRWLAVLIFCALQNTAAAEVPSTAIAQDPIRFYGERVEYRITRNGKSVGSHEVVFQQQADALQVEVESNIRITVLKVPVFRFRYRATEQWQSAKLVSIDAETVENGERTVVGLQNRSGQAELTLNGSVETAAALRVGSNHWNPEVLQASRVFNTLTGEVSDVEITLLGSEPVSVGESSVDAQRYRYTGDIEADVWYDAQGRWLKLAFKGTDGSQIEYTVTGFDV